MSYRPSSEKPFASFPILAAGASAISAGDLGVWAIARGERSTIVWVIATLGVIVLVMVAGELLVPH